jgi:hypothetical protein
MYEQSIALAAELGITAVQTSTVSAEPSTRGRLQAPEAGAFLERALRAHHLTHRCRCISALSFEHSPSAEKKISDFFDEARPGEDGQEGVDPATGHEDP